MESINVDPTQNENTEKDAKIQELVQNEVSGQVVQIDNMTFPKNEQHEGAEHANKVSSTCEPNDRISETEAVEVPISAASSGQAIIQITCSQVESMEQVTPLQSQETTETVGANSRKVTNPDQSTINDFASEEVIDSAAIIAIEVPASMDDLNSPASNAKVAEVFNSQEQQNVTKEQHHQEVQVLEGTGKITEFTEAEMAVNNSVFSAAENKAIELSEKVTATNDVPQIIENLILVKSFSEQSTVKTVNESQAPVAPQLELDTPMETNESAKLENTSQVLELPCITTASFIPPPFKTPIIPSAQSGLSMLAQYDSEEDSEEDSEDKEDSDDVSEKRADNEIERISDTESVVEVPTTNRDYRNRIVEIDSDSDSESDSSDSDVASEVSYLAEIRKAIDKSIEVDADVDADAGDEDEFDDNGIKTKRQPPRVKGEFLISDLPPIQDLHITVPEAECVELGKVHSIVDQLVLVNALPNSVLLDLETVLFLDKGQRVLGEVFDVLGQVADPLYCVRFNSNKQILEKNIKIGDLVFVAPKTQYTQFVILSSLMKMRGSDASWENDVEPPPRYLDYSDDEQERDARARIRNRDRSTDHWDPSKRARSDLDFSSPSPSMSPSPSPSPFPRNPFHQMRPHGGRGGFRPPRYQHPPQEYQQRPSYNAGSWHSNYPQSYAVPPQSFATVSPPHMMFAQPPPPPNFIAYPPQVMPMQPYPVAQPNMQQPPPQVYVLNPYAVRPPVLAHNSPQTSMYTTVLPPPPPPGNI